MSTSTNSGRAPTLTMAETVEKKVNGVVMTASPGPTPSAISASKSASLPDATPTAAAVKVISHLIFETFDGRTQYELLRIIYVIDRLAHLVAKRAVLRAQIDDGNFERAVARHWFWQTAIGLSGHVPPLRQAADRDHDRERRL
jgi:hypothetical protein